MRFECAARTHVGLRRKLNEDALLSAAERGIWAIADGMGGHDAGEVASALVIEALERLAKTGSLEDWVGQVRAALGSVNETLQLMARAGMERRVIGSTVVGLLADQSRFACFWAGDSRAFLVRGKTIAQLTRDHSLVQDLVDAGMIDQDDAESHPNANVITRAVGAADKLVVDSVSGDLQAGDVMLLASDGLTRVVGNDELLAVLSGDAPEAGADRLVAMTLERGAPDNLSLVIIRVA